MHCSAHGRRLLMVTLALLGWMLPSALAQNFDGDRFLDQCLRLEAGGDHMSARESCLNALEVNPGNDETILALARLETELGMLSSAENRLLGVRARVNTGEPALLLARIALELDRTAEAEGYLATAASQLAARPNTELNARLHWLSGTILESQGEMQEALAGYRRASAAEPLVSRYAESAAGVLLRMGMPEAAASEVREYRSASGDAGPASLHSLMGQALWAAGELEEAAAEYEQAFALRAGRDADAQASDLRSLAAIYLGQGDVQGSSLAFRDSLSQGNLLRALAGNALIWLLLLLLLAAVQLFAESGVSQQRAERPEGPVMWTPGHAYGIAILAALGGLVAAIAYSKLVLDNWLALVTPLQWADAMSVYLIVMTLIAVAAAAIRVRRLGWDPTERLLDGGSQLVPGIILGAVLLGVIVLWRAFVPGNVLSAPWYLGMNRLTPLILAAAIIVPFSELYLRGFVLPAFSSRYGSQVGILLAAALGAILFGTPVVLLLVLGIILGAAFNRTRSGVLVLAAQLTVSAGLLVLTALVPWVGSLFR